MNLCRDICIEMKENIVATWLIVLDSSNVPGMFSWIFWCARVNCFEICVYTNIKNVFIRSSLKDCYVLIYINVFVLVWLLRIANIYTIFVLSLKISNYWQVWKYLCYVWIIILINWQRLDWNSMFSQKQIYGQIG